MLVTEADAKTKWCPHQGPHRSLCLGTGCMAWRWAESETQTIVSVAGPKPEGDGWERLESNDEAPATRWQRVRPDRKGLCGLAGGSRG